MGAKAVKISVRSGLLAMLFGALALLATPGVAGAAWSANQVIAGSGPAAAGSTVAGLPDGQTVAVWTQPAGGFPAIYASRLAVDGTPGPAVLISTVGQTAETPVVTLAPDGNATIAWVRTDGPNSVVQSATFSAAGVAGPVIDRSASGAAGQDAVKPRITAAPDGSVAMVWRKFNGTSWLIQSLVVSAGGTASSVSDSQPLAVDSGFPDIAAKPDSTFVLASAVGSGAVANVVEIPIAADGTPGATIFVSTDAATGDPANMEGDPDQAGVGVDSNGKVVLVWRRLANRAVPTPTDPTPPPDLRLTGESLAPTTSPIPPSPSAFTPADEDISQLVFAMSPKDTAAVAWKAAKDGRHLIQTARLRGNAGWILSHTISGDVGAQGFPSISVNAQGWTTVAWQLDSAIPGLTDARVLRISPTSGFGNAFEPAPAPALASGHAGVYTPAGSESTVVFDQRDGGSNDVVATARFTDPAISTSPPATVKFGRELVNLGTTRPVTIINPGTTANRITAISMSGPDVGQFTPSGVDACVRSISANGTCPLQVRFQPDSAGTKTASIEIDSVAGNKVVNLTGNGEARTIVNLKVKPKKFKLKRGKPVKVSVKLTNTGGIAATGLKVCSRGNKKVVRPKKSCKKVNSLPAGAAHSFRFKVKLNGHAKRGREYPVSFRYTAGNTRSAVSYKYFSLKGKKKKKKNRK